MSRFVKKPMSIDFCKGSNMTALGFTKVLTISKS